MKWIDRQLTSLDLGDCSGYMHTLSKRKSLARGTGRTDCRGDTEVERENSEGRQRLAFSCIVSSIGLRHEQTIRLVTCRFVSDRPRDRVNWCVIRLLFTWNGRTLTGDQHCHVFSPSFDRVWFLSIASTKPFDSKVSSTNFRKGRKSNKMGDNS